MSLDYVAWFSNERAYVSSTPWLTWAERDTLRDEFIEWVQQDLNFSIPGQYHSLNPDERNKKLKKIRKRLKKDLKKGRVFPGPYYIEQRVKLPRGGASYWQHALNLDLTRDQVLFWLVSQPDCEQMIAKLARFRNPDDFDRIKRNPARVDNDDLAFFAELHSRRTRQSGGKIFNLYNMKIQGVRYRCEAVDQISWMNADQLHYWFDDLHDESKITGYYGDEIKHKVEKRLVVLEKGASSAAMAFGELAAGRLTEDQLAYWAAETGAAVFEIHLLVRTGAANDFKHATELVYYDRMYRAGPGAEDRIVDRDPQEVWKEALTPTLVNAGEWSTWGDDALRLVCQHYPVEDNRFYPLGLLLKMAGNVGEEKEFALLDTFQTLVGLCNEDPRVGWIGAIVANKPQEWMDPLLSWKPPELPAYTP